MCFRRSAAYGMLRGLVGSEMCIGDGLNEGYLSSFGAAVSVVLKFGLSVAAELS